MILDLPSLFSSAFSLFHPSFTSCPHTATALSRWDAAAAHTSTLRILIHVFLSSVSLCVAISDYSVITNAQGPRSLSSRHRTRSYREEHCFQVWMYMGVKCLLNPVWHRPDLSSVLRCNDLNQNEEKMGVCFFFCKYNSCSLKGRLSLSVWISYFSLFQLWGKKLLSRIRSGGGGVQLIMCLCGKAGADTKVYFHDQLIIFVILVLWISENTVKKCLVWQQSQRYSFYCDIKKVQKCFQFINTSYCFC